MSRQLHIQLVSNQLLGNLIPALMERPAEAALIVTPSMSRQADRLQALEEQAGIRVRRFDGAREVDLPRLEDYALEVIAELEGSADELVLNLTGGTKLMAIGFLDVLREHVDRCMYTDTAHGRLELLPLSGERQPPRRLDPVLDVETYLLAQGFRPRHVASRDTAWQTAAQRRKPACKWLGKEVPRIGDFLGALNALAASALDREGELVAPEQAFEQPPHGRWERAITHLRDEGLLDWRGGAQVTFLDAERTRFLNGGWLEEYVYHRLRDEGVDDVALGVTGTWDGTDGARNELDVVAVHANQLLVVECKTERHGRDEAGDDHRLYKLDSLGDDVRGLFGHSWMASARPPTKEMGRRAAQHRIQLISPEDLPKLRDWIRSWMADVQP